MANLLGMGGQTATNAPIQYSGLNVGSSMQNLPVPIFWGQRRLSTNAIWYNNFQQHSVGGKGGGGKGGGGKGSGQYDYTADTMTSLSEGTIDAIIRIWAAGSTTTTTTLAALNQTFFSGTATQSVWGYLASNYPAQALAYSLTSYLATPSMDLGASATIPDNQYECLRVAILPYSHTTANGWIDPNSHAQATAQDVLLSDVINDLLTNPQYGLGFASGDISSMAQYAAYQRAQGLFFSPLLNNQEKCTDVINRWAQLSNSWIYWSGTQLQFVPLGDSAITANGTTYTPDNSVAYNLSLADFVGNVPLKVSRADPADCYNTTTLSICDRSMGYVTNPIQYKDQTLVDEFGQRNASSTQADEICDPAVGQIAAQLIGKRAAYIRNTYSFKTSYRFVRCLPGTVLTLTEPNIGINQVRAKVRTVEDDGKGSLSFLCEEFPALVSSFSQTSPVATNVATVPNWLAAPGLVNTPAIVEPPATFTGGVTKVLISASGGANWGGCHVWMSFDGVNYTMAGTINAPAPQGLLTAALPAYSGANPDNTNTLAVDCTQSSWSAQPVSHSDAQMLRTLSVVAPQPSLVGGAQVMSAAYELLAFGATSATGTYAANLTYLERGQFGTSALAHAIGEQFTLIDTLGATGTTLGIYLPPAYVGLPIYFKFASFNDFGLATQDLSVCTEYEYAVVGAAFGMAFSCFVFGEVPTGAINGANTAFTLSTTPYAASVIVIYNGQVLTLGTDYTIATNVITMGHAPASGDIVTANYVNTASTAPSSGGPVYSDMVFGEVPGGAINGSNAAFTLASAPYAGTAVALVYNGQILTRGTDYTVSGAAITMARAPATGDALSAYYVSQTTTTFANVGPTFGSFKTNIVPAGAINGSNTAFTLPSAPHIGLVMVLLNGFVQTAGTDYTISGAVITLAHAPSGTDVVTANYIT